MTNGDITPPVPANRQEPVDPVADLERAAEQLAAISPAVISALGHLAAAEVQRPVVSERVQAAAMRIVASLSEIAEANKPGAPVIAPEMQPDRGAETAPPEPIEPAALTPQHSEQLPPSEPVSLPAETVQQQLGSFLAALDRPTVNIGEIARNLAGGGQLSRDTYRTLINTLNADPRATFRGDGFYDITAAIAEVVPSEPLVDESPVIYQTATQQPGSAEHTEQPAVEPSLAVERPDDAARLADNESASASDEGETRVPNAEHDERQADPESDAMSDEELIGMVARFVGRRTHFTAAELREHLLNNDAVEPDIIKGNRINAFIAEFMPYVEEYYFDRGDIVTWMDSVSDPAAVSTALDGRMPRAKTYVLGFRPRTVTKVDNRFIPTRTAPQITEGQQERETSLEYIQRVVDTVASIGNEASYESIVEILTDSETDPNPPTAEQVENWIDSAKAAGYLFRKGVGGYKGVSLFTKDKQPTVEIADPLDPAYIDKQLSKYETVAEAVMDNMLPRGSEEGKTYSRLWNINKDKLKGMVTYDEFKELARYLVRDGLVGSVISKKGDARLHAVSNDVRTEWRMNRAEVIERLRGRHVLRLQQPKGKA